MRILISASDWVGSMTTVALVLTSATFVASANAQSVGYTQVIYSNLTTGGSGSGFSSFSTASWCVASASNVSCANSQPSGGTGSPTSVPLAAIAAPFTPNGTGAFAFQSISLPLSVTGGGGAVITLAQSSGGAPGNVVESWTVTNLPVASNGVPPALTTVTDNLGISLQGGVQYFLIVSPMSPLNDLLNWNVSNQALNGALAMNASVWQQLPPGTLPAFSVAGYSTSFLPHFASGGGWTTVITLFSSTVAHPIPVIVNFVGEDGLQDLVLSGTITQQGVATPFSGGGSIEATLAPNSPLLISVGGPTGLTQVGSVQVLSAGPLGGFAIFRQTPPTGSPSEGTAPLQTQSPYTISIPYDNTANFITGIALAGCSVQYQANGLQQVTATFFDDSGNQLGAQQSIALNSAGHISFSLPDKFPVTTGALGVMQVTADGCVSGLGLRFSPFGTFTSIPTTIVGPTLQ